MQFFKDHPGVGGIAAGIVTLYGANRIIKDIVGPTHCRDGWASPSIGQNGACSWHGGVDGTAAALFLFLAVPLAIGVGLWVMNYLDRLSLPPKVDTKPPRVAPNLPKTKQDKAVPAMAHHCASCGAPKEFRLTRYEGRPVRSYVCSRSRTCTGSRKSPSASAGARD